MHTLIRCRISRRNLRLAAGLIAFASCGVVPTVAAGSDYVPTMKDMMSIQATMHRYHEGLDQHDNKMMASAFTEDGALVIIDHGKQVSNVRHDQMASGGLFGARPPAAVPGAQGAASGPPSAGAGGAGPAGAGGALPPTEPGDLWHFTEVNSYFKFESPTRATHYAYWMDVHVHEESHSSTLGIPGHYDDVLVKRHGEWLFLSRRIVVGTK